MALFSRKKKEDTKAEAPAKAAKATKQTKEAAAAPVTQAAASVAHVLLNPRITEKATMMSGVSAYVFDVATSANKKEIEAAVMSAFKVTPRMVRIVNIRPKNVRNMRTGKRGVKQGGKKAYVYLNKGETISIA